MEITKFCSLKMNIFCSFWAPTLRWNILTCYCKWIMKIHSFIQKFGNIFKSLWSITYSITAPEKIFLVNYKKHVHFCMLVRSWKALFEQILNHSNCYLAAPRPTLGHYPGDSLTHPMHLTHPGAYQCELQKGDNGSKLDQRKCKPIYLCCLPQGKNKVNALL